MRFLCLVILAYSLCSSAQAENLKSESYDFLKNGLPPVLGFSTEYSKIMFDRQNHVTDKALKQLQARQNGQLEEYNAYIGGRFIGTYIAERTNTDGKFPILSRLPPTHTQGNSDSYGVINDISVNGTVVLPYVTGFVQGEYTEVEYPGQDQKQIRKYWVTIGDLDKFPVYATIGKKTVNFGDFSSYAPFTHTHSSHYFWAQTDEPLLEVGYYEDGTHLSASLIKNDRGLRVLNSPTNDDKYENFALNGYTHFDLGDDTVLKVGAGFLRGSIYDSTLAHHPPGIGNNDRFWNELWDVNATLSYENFDFMGEFTRTFEEWPATDSHVHALTLQGRYKDEFYEIPVILSLSYSEGVQGDSGDEWEKMQQVIVGAEAEIFDNVSVGAEYMFNAGFVPLILPRVTADDGVVSHTGIVGVKATF